MSLKYIWQCKDWPRFRWQDKALDQKIYEYMAGASRLVGEVKHLSEGQRTEAFIDLMISEAIKTSQIEGESFDRKDVRSSLRNQLGLSQALEVVKNPQANGVSALMISVRDNFDKPLTAERLYQWQSQVVANSHWGSDLVVGGWRNNFEPMQIVSGPVGRREVHYEAPPSAQVAREMENFIKWFNDSRNNLKGPLRAGVAHLYFECIHPFDDGNGRVGRALSEMALSQELGHPVLLSLSTAIEKRREDYYAALKKASYGDTEITEWLLWFLDTLLISQQQGRKQIEFVISKTRFWSSYGCLLNERQKKVLQRMFREGVDGFIGGMSARKYSQITNCSKTTATRDLTELLKMGAIKKLPGSGRSTRYDYVLKE